MSPAVRADVTGAVPANPAAAAVASREARLLVALAGLFVTNALQTGSLSFTAGVMLWPVVFIMTDVVNGHFGPRGVPDMQAAFASVFGQGLWTIGGSVTAFLVGQLAMAIALIPLLYLSRRWIRAWLARPAAAA